MDQPLKRHFWMINAAFALTAMTLVARTANTFVEAALLPVPSFTPGKPSVPQQPLPVLEPQWLSRLTGLPLPKAEPLPELRLTTGPVRSTLRLRVLGTLIAPTSGDSVAAIQDAVTLRSKSLRIGDTIQSAEVFEIERARVILLNAGRLEFIDGTAGEGRPPEARPSTISKTGENAYVITRAERDRTLANLMDIAGQARIVPSFKDGVATGFKVFSIRPDSLYTRLGIQNGDVITRINGFALDSPEKGIELYLKLKEANRIDLDVDRNGALVRSTYNIQ